MHFMHALASGRAFSRSSGIIEEHLHTRAAARAMAAMHAIEIPQRHARAARGG